MKEFLSAVFAVMGVVMFVIGKESYKELKSQYEYELAIITVVIFWMFGFCCLATSFYVTVERIRF